MWLGLVSLVSSWLDASWQFLGHLFRIDRHGVAWPCLPHSWHRLVAISLLPTVTFGGCCLHMAGCLNGFATICRVDGQYGLALSPSSLAFPVLPLGCIFRFVHCSLAGYRLFLPFACLSFLVTCQGAPGDAQVVSYLLLVPVSLLFHLVAKFEFPSPSPSSLILSSILLWLCDGLEHCLLLSGQAIMREPPWGALL